MHISALPGSPGIGDIGDASMAFLETVARMRLAVWQMLPIGPTGFGNSPYQALSTFAGNEMLIGLNPLIRAGWLTGDELNPLAALPAGRVDFARLLPLKSALLELAARRFLDQSPPEQAAEFESFKQRHDEAWLDGYSLFRVIKHELGGLPWWEWPDPLRDREADSLNRLRSEHADRIAAVKAMQFWFDGQWRRLRARAGELGIRLFGDLPIYIAMDSADAWLRRDLLQLDDAGRPLKVAGVPPDYFSEDGQLWGNPLYDWPAHEAEGFAWWAQRMKQLLTLFDLVRIDHFRGFESYWAVPADRDNARDGAWEPGPGDKLFTALKDELGELPVVAEDLGVITDEVTALRQRHGLPGMRILQFDVDDPEFDIRAIAENCVVYSGTHDNNTVAGWYRGGPGDPRTRRDIRQSRRRARVATGRSARTIARGMVRLAFKSPARLAIAPMQDYLGLGSKARMNTPGSDGDHWSWRMTAGQLSPGVVKSVSDMVRATSREPDLAVQSEPE